MIKFYYIVMKNPIFFIKVFVFMINIMILIYILYKATRMTFSLYKNRQKIDMTYMLSQINQNVL